MGIAITTMSSKGQVVIPSELRSGFKEGDKLLIIRNDERIIMKKADKNLEQDLEFAKRADEAFRKYERGEFVEEDFDKFLEKAKKW
ncbi:AbrB/MazE/SpoVT family DNA-binding domain-containing protein [Candidatus Woesearchaeota archaeon]|nr:AbrB/MazE/SpoVT family DNA-binding domain-containing protein [Candidatus Woesearchaeota archaeon]